MYRKRDVALKWTSLTTRKTSLLATRDVYEFPGSGSVRIMLPPSVGSSSVVSESQRAEAGYCSAEHLALPAGQTFAHAAVIWLLRNSFVGWLEGESLSRCHRLSCVLKETLFQPEASSCVPGIQVTWEPEQLHCTLLQHGFFRHRWPRKSGQWTWKKLKNLKNLHESPRCEIVRNAEGAGLFPSSWFISVGGVEKDRNVKKKEEDWII